MAKYRTKSLIVDAVQWWPGGLSIEGVVVRDPDGPTPQYLHDTGDAPAWVPTTEGGPVHELWPGDWIISGTSAGKQACKRGLFEETYEALAEKRI